MNHASCESNDCSHNVAGGFRLCVDHRRALVRQLRTLPGLYRDCGERLTNSPQGMTLRVTTSRPVGISLNEAAMGVRSDMLDVLGSWCALVVQERGAAAPSTRTVEDLVLFLHRHLVWLTGHPAVGDLVTEVRELALAATEVADDRTRRSRQLGPCGRPGCARVVSETKGVDGRGHQVRCAAGHVWLPHEWLSLSVRMRQAVG
jgi:hypothetical protein